jgi:hypothetical protein
VFFNFLGLAGFVIFIVSFTILMVFTPFFSTLRAAETMKPVRAEKATYAWFFGGLAAGVVFGTLVYVPLLLGFHGHVMARELVPQNSPWAVGMWAFLCGLFSILCMIISYRLYGKKHGFGVKERGLSLSRQNLGKTVLLALITVTVSYGIVFLADFFFKTDFRIWVIAVKSFTASKIPVMLFPYLILFLTYYTANSVAVNAFNFITIGKREWVNCLIVAVCNGLPALILISIQYIAFRVTGEMGIRSGNMVVIWLFPILIFLPVTAVMTRKVYRVTGNPYLPGIINGIIVTIISCTNTLTWL